MLGGDKHSEEKKIKYPVREEIKKDRRVRDDAILNRVFRGPVEKGTFKCDLKEVRLAKGAAFQEQRAAGAKAPRQDGV